LRKERDFFDNYFVVLLFFAFFRSGGWNSAAKIISDLADYFTEQEQREDFKNFIWEEGYRFGAAVNILHEALKKVDYNLHWSEIRLSRNSSNIFQLSGTLLVFVVSVFILNWKE